MVAPRRIFLRGNNTLHSWRKIPISNQVSKRFVSQSAFNTDTKNNHKSTAAKNKEEQLAILSLPLPYLRAMDKSGFDPTTHQRSHVHYDPQTGKPIPRSAASRCSKECRIESCSLDATNSVYRILWKDGLESEYDSLWVEHEIAKWQGVNGSNPPKQNNNPQITLWSNMTDERVRNSELSMSFQTAVFADGGMRHALQALYQYGILLVTNTPTNDGGAGLAALASSLGGGSQKTNNPTSLLHHYRRGQENNHNKSSPELIMLPHGTDGPFRTLYGTVWSTASSGQEEGASIADSAYGQEGLPLHTDMTYQQDPPGLQIFTMAQPSTKGGESVYGDGFAVAERLRVVDPEAFETLRQTVRRYRCMDGATGWHLEAHAPVLSVRPNGRVVGIRHNDLDRLPDIPPFGSSLEEQQDFYSKLERAHQVWDDLLGMDEFRLVMPLKAGDTMVVANHVSPTNVVVLYSS